ncbi:MAG: hypothetical protein M3Y53_02170 [Thermoproteota archaeon]|nr:hypothetical protein [Thermoproteota archaeon]
MLYAMARDYLGVIKLTLLPGYESIALLCDWCIVGYLFFCYPMAVTAITRVGIQTNFGSSVRTLAVLPL